MLRLKSSTQRDRVTPFSEMMKDINTAVGDIDSLDAGLTDSVFGFESISDANLLPFNAALDDLETVIDAAFQTMGFENMSAGEHDIRAQAAASSVLMALDPQQSMAVEVSPPSSSNSMHRIIGDNGDALTTRDMGKECYSSRNTDTLVTHTCSYNIAAGSPSDFLQATHPLIMINASDAGIRCVARLMFIHDDVLRDLNGGLADYNKRSLTQAAIDPTILQGSSNKVVPIYRATSVDKFVPVAQMGTRDIVLNGDTVTTSALAIDVSMDIIGLSQTDALLASGTRDESDQLDAAVTMTKLYVGVGAFDPVTELYANVLAVNTMGRSAANFTPSRQGSETGMNLNFTSDQVTFNKDSKYFNGDPILAAIVDNSLTVLCTVKVSGSVDIRAGELAVYGNMFRVNAVYDEDHNLLPETNALYIEVADHINGERPACNIVGYDTEAFHTNLNHREKGDNLGSASYVEECFVPLRPPITCSHYTGEQHSSEEVDSLVSLLHTRLEHEAVQGLHDTAAILKDNELNGIPGVVPDILGFGRLWLTPKFIYRGLDLAAEVMGLNSATRAADLKATLVNAIRDTATRLYWDSGYEAASRVLNGGRVVKPTVVIATNARIAEHIYESGDERILGDMFNFKVVTSPVLSMKNKIYLTFSIYDENRHTTPNPLSFGFTAMAPEVVYNLTVPRGGKVVDELGVFPRYRVCSGISPVMALIEIPEMSITQALGAICNQPAGCP